MINEPDKDFARAKFMEALIVVSRAKDGLLLSEWELSFIGSYQQTHQYHRWFTPGRRKATDHMWQKYGSEPEIAIPFPLADSVPEQIADADPDGCEYLVREDGRQRRCNDPAEKMRGNGFRYCGAHADQVQRDLKRGGKVIHLMPFKGNAK